LHQKISWCCCKN